MTDDKKPSPPAAPAAKVASTDGRINTRLTPPAPPPAEVGKLAAVDMTASQCIRVAEVKWSRHIQLPGKTMNDDAVQTKTDPNGRSWTVDYLPAFRHFRIVHADPAGKKPTSTRYVHETWAMSWEPAP